MPVCRLTIIDVFVAGRDGFEPRNESSSEGITLALIPNGLLYGVCDLRIQSNYLFSPAVSPGREQIANHGVAHRRWELRRRRILV